MSLPSYDIFFLCKKTKLSEKQLLCLAEEDFSLMLDALTDVTLDDAPISFELFCKLTILKESKGLNYPLTEKIYVANCIPAQYHNISTRSHYVIDNININEDIRQFYLILTGMFPERIIAKASKGAPNLEFYINYTKSLFFESQPSLSNHLEDWIDLLYYIKNYCWS